MSTTELRSALAGSVAAPTGDEKIERVVALLDAAHRVLVITGAGMSADSGLPTYRGIGGLYDREPTEDGVEIEDALSAEMFARDPALTWKYIAQIERACRGASANEGHRVLASMAPHFERFCVLTQNVDGFHADAGSRDVIEMHGNMHRLYCMSCGARRTVEDFAGLDGIPPGCAECGGMLRPAVILFGEMLPSHAVLRYEHALADGFDLIIVIGTSAVFPYIAQPVRDAWADGRSAVEINPTETEVSRFCQVTIQRQAAATLTELHRRLQSSTRG